MTVDQKCYRLERELAETHSVKRKYKRALEDSSQASHEVVEMLKAELASARAEFKTEHDRIAERYRQKERANKEWTSNDQVTFGKLYEERDAVKAMCERANQYLREGKARFTPNTTNSFVDTWLAEYDALLDESKKG